MIGGPDDLRIEYSIYRFAYGQYIAEEESEELYKTYEINSSLLESGNTTIQNASLYKSEHYILQKTNLTHIMFELDLHLNPYFPSSVINIHPETKQVLCVSLGRYVLLIIMKSRNVYGVYELDDFEDTKFKIKSFDISRTGSFYVFLLAYKSRYSVSVMFTEYAEGYKEQEIFQIEFDYSLDLEKQDIKDIRFVPTIAGGLCVMLLLGSGEVATYNLEFFPEFLGDFFNIFFDNEFSSICFFIVFAMIFTYLTRRLRAVQRNPVLNLNMPNVQ